MWERMSVAVCTTSGLVLHRRLPGHISDDDGTWSPERLPQQRAVPFDTNAHPCCEPEPICKIGASVAGVASARPSGNTAIAPANSSAARTKRNNRSRAVRQVMLLPLNDASSGPEP